MAPTDTQTRKVTISLPEELVVFADQWAQETRTSRSQVISLALAELKALEEARLAAEGYQFYAAEAMEFAAMSAAAVADAINDRAISDSEEMPGAG